jgi:HK97 family phage portal protein
LDFAKHALGRLLKAPNIGTGGAEFWTGVYSYKLISGNAYILALGAETPLELHTLRPDRVSVLAGKNGSSNGYRYSLGNNKFKDYKFTEVLHLTNFHPLDDWYGLAPVEAAAYSIDQHNQAGAWNQSLLQNGARPSGALVVKQPNGEAGGNLSEDQYNRIKAQIDNEFAGSHNAGRPILLEGGLDWKEMSLSPKDMDFIEMKNSAARDIALAFGVPPQLLGIPGDNTYSNLAEARLAFWEQTIIPLVNNLVDELNNWLTPKFERDLVLEADLDSVPALAPRREAMWDRVNGASFLTAEEKRKILKI